MDWLVAKGREYSAELLRSAEQVRAIGRSETLAQNRSRMNGVAAHIDGRAARLQAGEALVEWSTGMQGWEEAVGAVVQWAGGEYLVSLRPPAIALVHFRVNGQNVVHLEKRGDRDGVHTYAVKF